MRQEDWRKTRPSGASFTLGELAQMIDHALLKPEATREGIEQLCREAREYGFVTVCVNPFWVETAIAALQGSPIRVVSVAGFPLGANLPQVKAFEAENAIQNGASEVDMVMNVGALKSGDYPALKADIQAVVDVCARHHAVCKVIIEAALLTESEKVKACQIAQEIGADYVKTSTGFGPPGATVEDVALIRRTVGPKMGVKASAGIKTYEQAKNMIEAGATRLGTSSGAKIMEEAKALRE